MKPIPVDTSNIPGWGVDADPRNDPTYPIRDMSGDDMSSMNWQRPPQQPENVEVLRSIEHNRLPAVFGTSTPPSGLSGMIRRSAFKYSENNWMHWLMLMGADRVNVVEGVLQDLGRGKVPNIPAEMGARAEWTHNKPGFFRKILVTAAVTAAAVAAVRALSSGGDKETGGNERLPERENETSPG